MTLPLCHCCEEKPAACVGRYEAMTTWEFSCDDCCGHACEDGQCYRLADAPEAGS